MREMDGWRFIGYYGIIYLFFMLVLLIGHIPIIYDNIKPLVSIVFPIAGNNSLIKTLIVTTLMYWGMVCFYTLVIQKKRLKF